MAAAENVLSRRRATATQTSPFRHNGYVIANYSLKAFQSLILQQWRACLCYHSNGAEYDVKFCSGASCARYLLIEESGKHGGNHNGNQSNPTRRA